jgi:hypothetical protein
MLESTLPINTGKGFHESRRSHDLTLHRLLPPAILCGDASGNAGTSRDNFTVEISRCMPSANTVTVTNRSSGTEDGSTCADHIQR